MTEISSEAGKKIAAEINEKYPAMQYAMLKRAGAQVPAGSKISSYQVVSLTSKECELSYVTCRGDACSMPKKITYKFNPPLRGDKVFMLRLQSNICAPKFHWLLTKPLAFLILVTCSLLSVAAMGLGVKGMTEQIQRMPRLQNGVVMIFGSAHAFAIAVLLAWCVAVLAHSVECAIAYRHCERTLRFSNEHSSQWAFLVFLVGWPIFEELRELVEAKALHSKKEK